jgi:hypothetical protein
MTGHLLGGAGGLEAGITRAGAGESEIPPTMNLENPDPECRLDYVPNKADQTFVRCCAVEFVRIRRHQRHADHAALDGIRQGTGEQAIRSLKQAWREPGLCTFCGKLSMIYLAQLSASEGSAVSSGGAKSWREGAATRQRRSWRRCQWRARAWGRRCAGRAARPRR